MITQQRLKKLLHYNPVTGVFTRLSNNRALFNQTYWKGKTYVRIMVDGRRYKAHTLAWIYMTGETPKGVIDHINGEGSDNRFINLRNVPQVINCRNKKKQKNNVSGVPGVCWRVKQKRWIVQIGTDEGRKYLGSYKDFKDAVRVRKEAEKIHYYGVSYV